MAVRYGRAFVIVLCAITQPLWARSVPVESVESGISAQMMETELGRGIDLLTKGGSKDDGLMAVNILSSLAGDGDPTATLWLGKAYRDGLSGVEKNASKAFGYFMQAAGKEGKNSEAQYELGRAYFLGEGTDKNLIAAYMWTSISTTQSSPVTKQAEDQQKTLANMLTTEQLKTADILIDQMRLLYLNE